MAEIPEHLAKVLEDLETRKASLRHRLESLDSAISGIQLLYDLKDTDLPSAASRVQTKEQPAELLVRESVTSEIAPSITPSPAAASIAPEPAPVSPPPVSGVEVMLNGNGNHHADSDVVPRAAPPAAPPERRKKAQLNVYVNQNTEWAARQFVAPQSSRAIFRHKTGHRCPTCGSQDTRVSFTKGMADAFMFLFDYSIARCRNCDTRFRIWRSRGGDEDAQDLEPQPSTE